MPNASTKYARNAVKDLMDKARKRITDAGAKAEAVRESSIYTHEGKRELAGGWAEEARKAQIFAVEQARTKAAESTNKSPMTAYANCPGRLCSQASMRVVYPA